MPSHIASITLDDSAATRRTPEMEHDLAVAVADMTESAFFLLSDGPPPPYRLNLGSAEQRLILDVSTDISAAARPPALRIAVPLAPLRSIIRDYFLLCDSYFEAIKHASPHRIETIDMARRGLHDEGARQLEELLAGKAAMDYDTSRRFFTLVCVLHMK